VVGANVAFFGERLSCRLVVEDLVALVEAHAKRPGGDALSAALLKQLSALELDSVDGVMCWDLFDHLDRATSTTLASRLVRLLKKGGVLYGFFGTSPAELTQYTRFIVQGPNSFRQRPYPATPTRRHVLQNRDLAKIFEGMLVTESVLLKTGARETLFRKT
jgi:predicted SAM-dependent methyltransferase